MDFLWKPISSGQNDVSKISVVGQLGLERKKIKEVEEAWAWAQARKLRHEGSSLKSKGNYWLALNKSPT